MLKFNCNHFLIFNEYIRYHLYSPRKVSKIFNTLKHISILGKHKMTVSILLRIEVYTLYIIVMVLANKYIHSYSSKYECTFSQIFLRNNYDIGDDKFVL